MQSKGLNKAGISQFGAVDTREVFLHARIRLLYMILLRGIVLGKRGLRHTMYIKLWNFKCASACKASLISFGIKLKVLLKCPIESFISFLSVLVGIPSHIGLDYSCSAS